MAFDRKTELYVGVFNDAAMAASGGSGTAEQQGYLVDDLDYEFDITCSTEYYKDSATFTIYNPNDETVQEIMTRGCSVIFRAGYADEDMATIFVGQIAMAYPEDDGAETTKLVLICKSQRGAQFPLQRVMLTAFIEEGKTYYDVMKTIADYVGVALTGAERLKKHVLDEAYLVNGNVREEMKNFTRRKLRALGGHMIISNNEMIYYEDGSIEFTTVELNYGSGLIKATPVRDETYQSTEDAFNDNREYYLGLKELKDFNLTDPQEKEQYEALTKKPTVQPKNEVDFECILHPGLHVLTPVHIDARKRKDDHISVLGTFYIKELHYQGGNFAGTQYNCTGRAWEYTIGEKLTGG